MKTNLIRIASLAVVALGVAGLGASRSSAAQYVDIDSYGPGGELIAGQTTFTGNFDIKNGDGGTGDVAGYTPGAPGFNYTLTSAFVSFEFFTGPSDIVTEVIVKLDTELVSGTDSSSDPIYSFIFGDLIGQGWVTLKDSGVLDFTIQNTGASELRLNSATLVAERGDGLPGTSVPDAGATAILFGTFSLAALAIRRRLGKIA